VEKEQSFQGTMRGVEVWWKKGGGGGGKRASRVQDSWEFARGGGGRKRCEKRSREWEAGVWSRGLGFRRAVEKKKERKAEKKKSNY